MADKSELTILQINDTHAYLDLHNELFWSGSSAVYRKAGGFGRIARIFDDVRKERPSNVLAFDCGDTFHGTHAAVATRGEVMVPALRALGLDGMTGHWDFAYGPERLVELVQQLPYPMLAINAFSKDTDDLVFPPYTILEAGGLRVGAIGIAATIVDKTMPEPFHKGIYLTLGNEELPGYIQKLRGQEKVDLIIVISHLGFPQDYQLAQEVDGIDVLLSGHTHNRMYVPAVINDTIVMQSGCQGSFVGRLDVRVEGGRIVDYHHRLIVVEESISPEPEMQNIVNQVLLPFREEEREVVGGTITALDRSTSLESTMDNFLLEALLRTTGDQIAFSNGWRYGAPVPQGPITVNDLWDIIPVNPPVSQVEMKGEEIWQMMEENLEHTYSRDPFCQMGGYVKRMFGGTMYIKIENPEGERIQRFFIQGKLLDLKKKYPVTYVTTQGVPKKYGTNRRSLDINAIDALLTYLKEQAGPIKSGLRGSVVAV